MRKSVLLILCIMILLACVGCGAKDSADDPAEKTLQVSIEPDTAAQIDLYWNYRSYSVRREDDSALIGRVLELLNGTYVLHARWVNSGTGSGDHITFYDAEGKLLKSYYIFRSDDGPFSLWEEGTEHFNYRRSDGRDSLPEIVKSIADEQYWGKMP